MPSFLTVAKPGSENVTVYTPGRSSGSRYWPRSSLTVDANFLDERRAGGLDGHAWQHGARGVADDAGDSGRAGALREH